MKHIDQQLNQIGTTLSMVAYWQRKGNTNAAKAYTEKAERQTATLRNGLHGLRRFAGLKPGRVQDAVMAMVEHAESSLRALGA